jgi:hypothetical protein
LLQLLHDVFFLFFAQQYGYPSSFVFAEAVYDHLLISVLPQIEVRLCVGPGAYGAIEWTVLFEASAAVIWS